jgi:hypothetical protein
MLKSALIARLQKDNEWHKLPLHIREKIGMMNETEAQMALDDYIKEHGGPIVRPYSLRAQPEEGEILEQPEEENETPKGPSLLSRIWAAILIGTAWIGSKLSNLFKRRDPGQKPGFWERLKVLGKWIGMGLAVVLALVLLLGILRTPGGPPSTTSINPAPTTTQAPQQTTPFLPPSIPEFRPIDLLNAPWQSPVQMMIVLSVLLIGFANYRDAKQRGQVDDFTATVWAVAKIVSATFIASLLRGPLSSKGFNDQQLLFFTSTVLLVWAFIEVYEASKQGGADYSPLGDLLITIAGWGLIFGTIGAVEYVFGIPKAPVLPFGQVETLFVLKRYSEIWMSLAIYTLLAAGVYVYGREVVQLTAKMTDAKEIAGTVATSFVGLIAYPLIRIFAGWTPIQSFAAALTAALLTGLVAVRVGITSPVTTGEGRIPSGVIIPWDKLAFQLSVGLLAITLLGTV